MELPTTDTTINTNTDNTPRDRNTTTTETSKKKEEDNGEERTNNRVIVHEKSTELEVVDFIDKNLNPKLKCFNHLK